MRLSFYPSSSNLLTLNFCKPLIDPFAPQYKPELDGSALENESVMRQDCCQDLTGISAPYFHNGSF